MSGRFRGRGEGGLERLQLFRLDRGPRATPFRAVLTRVLVGRCVLAACAGDRVRFGENAFVKNKKLGYSTYVYVAKG